MGMKVKKTKAGKPAILSFGGYTLDQEKFDKLLKEANAQERTTLKVLYNAVVKCINDLNANSSAISVKGWEKTKNSYEQYADQLWKKYFPEKLEEKEQIFPNVLAVVKHLKEQGWKIEKSKAYQDKKERLLVPRADGKFTLSDINNYIILARLQRTDGTSGIDNDRMIQERAQVELDKAKIELERSTRKNKLEAGLYVPRETFEQELTKRAARLTADAENYARSSVEKIIAIVGGDPTKGPALLEYQMDAIADWFNTYSADREFSVTPPAAGEILRDTEKAESDD